MFVMKEFALIWGLVLSVLSLNSVTAKKFCTAFNENNQKIDYAITQPNTNINFVIDGLFWTINQNSEKHNQKSLKFSSEESKTTTFFTSEYKFGSKVYFNKNGFVILFQKNDFESVAIGNATNGGENPDLSKFQKIRDSQVTNELIPNKALFAFPEDSIDEEPTKVVFVSQTDTGYAINLLQFEVISDSTIKASTTTSKYSMDVIPDAKNLVYVSSLWDTRKNTYKLFLLFKANDKITYCYTLHHRVSQTCYYPKVLISCSENGGNNSMTLIIAIIIIIIILIAIIIGFVVFYLKRPNESESVAANSQLSGMNAPLSKRSGDVNSKVASKIGPKNSANPTSKPS